MKPIHAVGCSCCLPAISNYQQHHIEQSIQLYIIFLIPHITICNHEMWMIIITFKGWFLTYTGSELGLQYTNKCPGTYWCLATSRRISAYNLFSRFPWLPMILNIFYLVRRYLSMRQTISCKKISRNLRELIIWWRHTRRGSCMLACHAYSQHCYGIHMQMPCGEFTRLGQQTEIVWSVSTTFGRCVPGPDLILRGIASIETPISKIIRS